MRIGEVKRVFPGPAGGEPVAAAGESRALVALERPALAAATHANYRPAPFLAHLLAVKDQHAQTRDKRRAEPHEAVAAYRATAGLVR
jgi:hypothetical protein